MGMTIEEAKKLDHFICADCATKDKSKRTLNSLLVSSLSETKVRMLTFVTCGLHGDTFCSFPLTNIYDDKHFLKKRGKQEEGESGLPYWWVRWLLPVFFIIRKTLNGFHDKNTPPLRSTGIKHNKQSKIKGKTYCPYRLIPLKLSVNALDSCS